MSYVSEVAADSPAAWWRLGDRAAGSTAADATGNGSTGTYDAGAADADSLLVSDSDHAADVTTGGVVVGSTSAALQAVSGTALTIEAWVKFNSATPGGSPSSWDYVVEQVVGSSNSKYYLWWGSQSGTVGWVFGFSPSGGTFRDHRFSWLPTVGVPYHVVVKMDASNVYCYVDGELIGTVVKGAGSIQSGGATARVGRYGGGSGGNFAGVLDEVAVYGSVLSDARIEAHYQAGIAAPPGTASSVGIAIPAGKVGSTLTDFVTRVDLAEMPSSWWNGTNGDLGNVRVRSAGVDVPVDVVSYDRAAETGSLFFKATLTTSENLFTVDTVEGATALDPSDPNGRDAVWSDYDAVFAGEQQINRVDGSAFTAVGTAPVGILDGEAWLDLTAAAGQIYLPGVPTRTQWTAGISTYSTDSTSSNKAHLSYTREGSTTNADRETMVDDGGDTRGVWNSSDSWRHYGSVLRNVHERRNLVHDGIASATMYANGVEGLVDTAVVQRPTGSPSEMVIGAGTRTDTGERWQGWLNYAYIRDGLLSADWIAAEDESWRSPASFYVVTAATFSLSETLPAVDESFTIRSYTDTDTRNLVAGISVVGSSVEPDNTDPVALPDDGTERRDKALWYPAPELVDGRPT